MAQTLIESKEKTLSFAPFFKFLASLKLAVFVLGALIASLATGTFLESYHGTDAARILVYQAPWFSWILILLAINLAASAFDRLPWKAKHTGFVMTHFGIILILAGSLLTQKKMVDGQMVIAEGETAEHISLQEPLLYFFSEKYQSDWLLPLKPRAFAWQGREEIKAKGDKLPLKIFILKNYPKTRVEEKLVPADQGRPALKVLVHNNFVNQSQWLVEYNEALGKAQLGPATLVFTQEFLKEEPAVNPESPYLEIQREGKTYSFALPENLKLPARFPLEDTPYEIQVLRVFKKAVVEGRELLESKDSQAEENPAAELILKGEGIEEPHTVFAKFPDFPTLHGMKPSAAGVRIFYRMPGAASQGRAHELRFVYEGSKLFYQIQTGSQIQTGEVVQGQEIPTGWMNLTFRVQEFYPSASLEREFFPAPSASARQDALPAIQVELGQNGEQKILWLRQGVRETAEMGGQKYDFLYGQKRIPAGFRLALKDFRLENYPGTDQPASFESDVTLRDDRRGVLRDVTISMNKPLKYRGYKIFQSGYSLNEGQPEVSIFAAARDPGIGIKYAGAIITIGGIAIMFYTRRFSTTQGRMA